MEAMKASHAIAFLKTAQADIKWCLAHPELAESTLRHLSDMAREIDETGTVAPLRNWEHSA